MGFNKPNAYMAKRIRTWFMLDDGVDATLIIYEGFKAEWRFSKTG
jgi:hypothetical protein